MSTKSRNTKDDDKRHAERNHGKAVSADADQMRAYKRFFHGKESATYQIKSEREGCEVLPKIIHGTIGECKKELLAANADGAMILMNVHETDGEGRKAKNIRRIKAVYIDLDDGLDLKKLKRLKLPPDLIARTSKRGGHAFWLVKDCSPEMFRAIQIALAKKFGADPSRNSPAHPNRMAGSVHYKGRPFLVETVHIDKHAKPISAKKLIDKLGMKIEKVADTESKAHVAVNPEATEAEIRGALKFIPVADKREDWLRIVMAIHAAMPNETGYAVGVEWSRQSARFDEQDQRRTWNGLRPNGGVSVATLFALAAKHGWKNPATSVPSDLPSTEFELLDSFADKVKDRLRFDDGLKKWLVFKQPVWRADEPAAVQCARVEIELMIRRAKESDDLVALALLKKYASVLGVRSLLSQATSHPMLVVRHQAFDQRPNLLAVQNGVIELTNGTIREGHPDDLLIRQAAATYDPDAAAPRFEEFIRFFTLGNQDYAAYLQGALGYTMFGHANEQKIFDLVGEGDNGKGVLNRRMEYVLGDYVTAVAPNLLTKAYSGNPQGPTPAFMALHGARMYQCGEGEDAKRFDTAFLKQLSGNDMIAARAGYGEQTQFRPVGTLWISSNSLPEVDRQDKAMWRRILILPCDAKVVKRDPNYEPALDAEASGILNWLIAGAIRYHKEGLGKCEAVKVATQRAKRTGDSVAAWVSTRAKDKEGACIQATKAYSDYRSFCRAGDRFPLSVHRFHQAMTDKGYPTKKTNRFNVYVGIRLIEG